MIIHEHYNREGGLKNRPRRGPPVWAEANDIALVHLATAVVLGGHVFLANDSCLNEDMIVS